MHSPLCEETVRVKLFTQTTLIKLSYKYTYTYLWFVGASNAFWIESLLDEVVAQQQERLFTATLKERFVGGTGNNVDLDAIDQSCVEVRHFDTAKERRSPVRRMTRMTTEDHCHVAVHHWRVVVGRSSPKADPRPVPLVVDRRNIAVFVWLAHKIVCFHSSAPPPARQLRYP